MKESSYIEIDIVKLIKALFYKVWIIVISAVVFASAAFGYATLAITPSYDADVLLYVNNSSVSLGTSSFSISSSEISAAQSLVDTYIVILKTRLTLDEVAEECKLDYRYNQLKSMISAEAVSGTEIFRVRVTSPSREHSEIIANTVAKVLPKKIAEVVDGSSVRIVDYAVKPVYKSGPNITQYTALGLAVGIFLACAGIIAWELTDTIIHDEEYLTKKFPTVPILAVIPSLNGEGSSSSYGYYYTSEEKSKKKGE